MTYGENNIKGYAFSIVLLILTLVMFSASSASAGINFNYTNVTPRNYTVTDAVLNTNNFVVLTGGNIEVPSITLKFNISKTLVSGSRSLFLNSTLFGPKTTTLPKQKVYIASGGTATVSYMVDASNSFANTAVNISTFKQVSNNVPFFSDFSIALLNFNDLKNTWNNDTKVLDELITTINNENKINETNVTLNAFGDSSTLSQNLAPGNYLILVTKGTDPKEIITWNIVKVMPFTSTIVVGDGSGAAGQGMDLNVSISLSGPLDNYTYITSIINRSDYADKIGNVNISWNQSGSLANSTRVNGTLISTANSITDIIPRSNTTRTTINSTTANLTLKTGSLPNGSYLVHTVVFNSTNFSVAFDQTLLTLNPSTTTPVNMIGNKTNGTQTIPTPDANITLTLLNNTKATLADGVTPISSISAISLPSVNSTLINAASGLNLRFIGKNVTLLPAGAIFNPYILVTFNYSQFDVPPGVGEGRINVYAYNSSTNSWEAQEVDSIGTYPGPGAKKFITVRVKHFSTFALLGIGPGPPPGVPGAGRGTGGAGVTTSEPFENIEKAERYDKDLIANAPVIYSYKVPELGIYEIAVTGKENENAIALRVELLKGTSKLVTASPPGTVYKNVNIWAGTQRIKEALIRFKVENSWLTSNNLAGSDVKMLKWDGSKWVQLETAETKKDDTYTYLETKTDTFSVFAIAGLKGVAVPTATPAVEVTPAVPTGTPAPTPTKKVPGFETIFALAGLLAIAYLLRRED